MAALTDDIGRIVGALTRVLREESKYELARLLANARIELAETSYDNWNGGTYGYTLHLGVAAAVYARLGETLDDVEKDLCGRIGRLIRLYQNEHVEAVVIAPDLEESPTDGQLGASLVQPTFWAAGEFRLFLSHVSAYRGETSALAGSLSAYGVNAFVAHEDIEPTREWEDEIRMALATCDALVCLLTEGFNSSKWTDQEVGFVIGRGALVIPVRLGLDPYGFMGRFQGYPGAGKPPQDLARGIVEILARHHSTRARMADGLIQAFEQSGSFAMARSRAQALRLVQQWTSEQTARVQRAMTENDQIAKEAYVVQSVVADLWESQRTLDGV